MQLLKCFEVANSLADTVLCTSSLASYYQNCHFGPQDLLHALYQKLFPFLEQDQMLNSILRTKAAEALVKAPARVLHFGTNERLYEENQSNSNIDDRLVFENNTRDAMSRIHGSPCQDQPTTFHSIN